MPRVTVLMTLFNKGPYVEEAVHSVLANSFQDLELLIVDDASTDDGLERVRAIADPRIRILESERNTGRAASANRGYDAARGEYVAVMDADDVAHAERIARQVAFMDADPDIGVCGSALGTIGGSAVLRVPFDDQGCRGVMIFGMPVFYTACMLRRSVLEEHHLRCNAQWRRPGMDYFFIVQVGFHTRYANLPDVLTYYRRGEQNMRHGRDPVEDHINIDREAFRLLGLPISEHQLSLQVHLHAPFPERLSAFRVLSLRAWVHRSIALNRVRRLFPVDLFEAEVERRWDKLFHVLVRRDVFQAFAHMLASGRVLERAGYLARFTWRRWRGREPA